MASSFILTAFFVFPLAFATNSPPLPSFKRIYVFGDSLSDTGNTLRLPGGRMVFPANRLPYGETYFGKATGRFSDGRLIIDYIAAALKLPFLDAYLNVNGSFAHGVNFAVGGATALDEDFFTKRNVTISNFKPPMSKQLEWFETHLNSTFETRAARSKRLKNSLFIFGEFGANDYFSSIRGGRSIEEVKTYVPYVVGATVQGIRRIVRLGAKRIVVLGTFPFGCMPSNLAASNASDLAAYDRLGCVTEFNGFSFYHNRFLRSAVSSLSRELSGEGVVVVYGDCEGTFLKVLRKASSFGFDKWWLRKACCGAGGKYNFDYTKPCGTNGAEACSHPDRAVHWDGVHLTDASNHRISQILIDQLYSKLI